MKKYILVLLTVVIFLSCQESTDKKNKTEAQNQSSIQEKLIEEKVIVDSNDFYVINAKYPVVSGDKNGDIELYINSLVNKKEEEWKLDGEEYQQWLKLNKDIDEDRRYNFTISYSIDSNLKAKTKSYIFDIYEFTGGAHGSSSVNALSFTDSSKIKLEDILNIENYNDISILKLIQKEANKNTEIFPDPELIDEGLGLNFLKSDGKTLDKTKCKCDGYFFASNLQKFSIIDKGLKFYFDKYVMAPGSSGNTEVLLTWEQLKPYLQEKFLPLIK